MNQVKSELAQEQLPQKTGLIPVLFSGGFCNLSGLVFRGHIFVLEFFTVCHVDVPYFVLCESFNNLFLQFVLDSGFLFVQTREYTQILL